MCFSGFVYTEFVKLFVFFVCVKKLDWFKGFAEKYLVHIQPKNSLSRNLKVNRKASRVTLLHHIVTWIASAFSCTALVQLEIISMYFESQGIL